MRLSPTYLVSEKAFGLISHLFQEKCSPLMLTPEIFHYLVINAACEAWVLHTKKSKKGQNHLPDFLKAK